MCLTSLEDGWEDGKSYSLWTSAPFLPMIGFLWDWYSLFLPTWMMDGGLFYGIHVGEDSSPMDPMGFGKSRSNKMMIFNVQLGFAVCSQCR